MLADVLTACAPVGETLVVTRDPAAASLAEDHGARPLQDPGGGQGAAVAAGLAACGPEATLIVNADLPCAVPRDLFTLLGALPADGVALVRAGDGTTNALALATPALFTPAFGPRSERRFREHAGRIGAPVALADIPNLADDVDTLEDLDRLADRLGPATRAVLESLKLDVAL